MNLSSFQTRIRIISVFIFLFASILIIKLFSVQIVHKNLYIGKADKQYATPAGDIFDRGSIFFSKKDGSMVAAGAVSSGFKIAMKPKEVTDPEATFQALDPYTEMEHDAFMTKAAKKNEPL